MPAAGFLPRFGQLVDAARVRVQRVGAIVSTTVQGALQTLDVALTALTAVVATKVAQVGTITYPAAAATITLTTSNIEVGIDATSTAVTVNLPSAAAWAAANPNGLELTIADIKGQAGTHAITPALNGADAFYYGGVTPVINDAFGLLKLRPAGSPTGSSSGTPITGWYVRGIN